MAFTVTHIWSHRRAGVDENGVRTYSDGFRVISDNPNCGPGSAGAALGYVIGQPYSSGSDVDAYATIRNLECNQTEWTDTSSIFEVQVEYSNAKKDPQNQTEDNPFDAVPKIRGGSITMREAYAVDTTGAAAVNKAGDPFIPRPERDVTLEVWTCTRNEIGFDRTIIKTYANTTSLTGFGGYLAGEAYMKSIEYEYLFASGISYAAVTYQVVFKPGGWKDKLLNQGKSELVGGVKKPIMEKDVQVSEDKLLTAAGAQLAVGGTPNYVELVPLLIADWSSLSLPI